MRKLFIYMSMTLDGFLCGLNGKLDWMLRTPDQELNDDIVTIISSADTDIIGYPTAIGMIPYWANVEKDNSASPNGDIEVRVNGRINRSKEDMNV